MPTYLTALIERSVQASLVNTISRTTEHIAEELAADLLRDPEFRATMRTLVRAAFERALTELATDSPAPPTDPAHT